jgi:predicted nuclease of predicted toxin-antitoxin system
MHNAADDEILAWSATGAIVVTLDADFHAILAVSGASGPSVIRLRIQGLRAPELTALIEKVVAEFQKDLQGGCLITVKAHKTTCHRLPIGGD